jgi:hypothetical protein
MIGSEISWIIEPAMWLVLGVLGTSLVSIIIIPLVHSRAVRLTTRRFSEFLPQGVVEINAERDMMRAEFSVALRKLEIGIQNLKGRTTAYATELSRKDRTVERLKEALQTKSRLAEGLEAREAALMNREQTLVEEVLSLRDCIRQRDDSPDQLPLPVGAEPGGASRQRQALQSQ